MVISFIPSKAPGPDNIPNRIFRDFADILAYSVPVLLKSSFQGQKLPDVRKLANVTPVPKDKPVTDINQHLRPISLTCSYIVILMSFHNFSSSNYDNTMMQINTWKRNICLTFYDNDAN